MNVNISNRSRLKLTWFASICIAILSGISIFKEMDAVAVAGVGALTLIIQQYLDKESNFPSKKITE